MTKVGKNKRKLKNDKFLKNVKIKEDLYLPDITGFEP